MELYEFHNFAHILVQRVAKAVRALINGDKPNYHTAKFKAWLHPLLQYGYSEVLSCYKCDSVPSEPLADLDIPWPTPGAIRVGAFFAISGFLVYPSFFRKKGVCQGKENIIEQSKPIIR